MTTTQIQPVSLETGPLKKFAQSARRQLIEQVGTKLDRVLSTDSAELREKEGAIKELKAQLSQSTKDAVIERVAYVWFNRLCALRFMDVNGYNTVRVVSPVESHTQPEILAEAKQGYIDDSVQPESVRQRILDLLSGQTPSSDPQQEAYRLLVVAMCNYYHSTMPFLFEKIADFTELLMPDDLLSDGSILAMVRNALTVNVCNDVEVIGWLYQFYISEKKDEVIEGLKKNTKISPENIPAATQLFTPNWIVRYIVENSLGRLWMLNKPTSRLVDRMNYYVQPEHEETNFVRVTKPEELKVCDPACGSGHMLVYAFDLLYAIYEEEGYEPTEIPRLILENNLYGIEIDERAGELAAFALVMKARSKYSRFFRKSISPNVCILENVKFESGELKSFFDAIADHTFKASVIETLDQFRESNNVGSLIEPREKNTDEFTHFDESSLESNIFLHSTKERVLKVLQFATYLSPRYHIVIANPPYMGAKGMNSGLKDFLQRNYPNSKSDLFSAFIERIMSMTKAGGFIGLMSPFNWMFLGSFEKLRNRILAEFTLTNLVRPEFHAFFDSAYVTVCAFTLFTRPIPSFQGTFIDLQNFYGADIQPIKALEAIQNPSCGWNYKASSSDLQRIPSGAIAYWLSKRVLEIFATSQPLSQFSKGSTGLQTSDSARFVRYWFECERKKLGTTWIHFAKGGTYRKWYGNVEHVVNWQDRGKSIKEYVAAKYPYLKGNYALVVKNESTYFSPGILTSRVTSGSLSFRVKSEAEIYADACTAIFPDEQLFFLALLSTKLLEIVQKLNPTLNFQASDIEKFPVILPSDFTDYRRVADRCINISRYDWDSYETSSNFSTLPLLSAAFRQPTLEGTYKKLRAHWQDLTLEMQRLEQENNLRCIELYGLQDELGTSVSLDEITLTCNPTYRYAANKASEEQEQLLLSDTLKEFISFSVGCMFGRYSLSKSGLTIADSDEQDLQADSLFPADEDNVIPMLEGDWFTDDISERFRKFLRITFGEDHYQDNLRFIETVLKKDIRKYFLKDFYNDHLKKYKKRPLYWLFSSAKGTFNALIYMHRYRHDTVSVILNDYLRELRNKLAAHKSHLETVSISGSFSAGEKTKALKEIEALKKNIDELDDYERDLLYPLAMQKIAINLDDGVKLNYAKFGRALRPVPGMNADEE